MPESHISDAMRSVVGNEIMRRVSYPVSESDIRRWAIAVHYPEPAPREYIDAEYAASLPSGGIVAPLEFNPFAWIVAYEKKPDIVVEGMNPLRTELTLGIPGPDVKFQLNGGMEVEYGVRMRPGDVVTTVTRLAEYREREGRLGLMLFTLSADTWTNQNDEMVKVTTNTLIRY